MNSLVHPKYKTKYRVTNWAQYERGLIQRGNVTIWLSPEAVASWKPALNGRRGGQRKLSDLAIETALTLRLAFHLPLRQTEGFLNSVIEMLGVKLVAPDHTTLSRRSQCLDVTLRHAPVDEPIQLIIDSAGLSIVGEGEWDAAQHGDKGKRGWKKLHLGVDGCGVIVAQVLTDGHADDAAQVGELLDAVEGDVTRVVADTAYDTSPCTTLRAHAEPGPSCRQQELRSCHDGDRDQPLVTGRSSVSRRSGDGAGRRGRATTSKAQSRTPSTATNRSSAAGFALAGRTPRRAKRLDGSALLPVEAAGPLHVNGTGSSRRC